MSKWDSLQADMPELGASTRRSRRTSPRRTVNSTTYTPLEDEQDWPPSPTPRRRSTRSQSPTKLTLQRPPGVRRTPSAPGPRYADGDGQALPRQRSLSARKVVIELLPTPKKKKEIVPDPDYLSLRISELQPQSVSKPPVLFPSITEYTNIPKATKLAQLHADTRKVSRSRLRPEANTKSVGTFRARSLKELKRYKPTELSFRVPASDEHLSDAWFEHILTDLCYRIREFAATYFGRSNVFSKAASLAGQASASLWLREPFSDELLSIIAQVARGDPVLKGPQFDSHNYEQLLLGAKERQFLVAGVVSKFIDTKVFGELLFGVAAEEKTILTSQDVALIASDGYMRTYIRATVVREMYPNMAEFPPNFWPEVKKLASEITGLLLPLINLQGHASPTAAWEPVTQIYQELHDIVGEAAFVLNMLRRTTTIFHVDWPFVGQYHDHEQEHVDDSIWSASEQAAKKHDSAKLAVLRNEGAAHSTKTDNEEWGLNCTRVGKVQIVMWPNIRRFDPQSKTLPGTASDGEKITTLTKSQVVYYHGLDSDEGESFDDYTVLDHIAKCKKGAAKRKWTQLRIGLWVVILPALVMVLAVYMTEHEIYMAELVDAILGVSYYSGLYTRRRDREAILRLPIL